MAGLVRGPSTQPSRGEAIAARLRCPVCQGLAVADSPSETARAMRATIDRMVAEGRSDREIIDYFKARYGVWVLLDPPPTGRALALWALPAAALLGGTVLVVRQARHSRTGPAPPPRPTRRRVLAGGALAVVMLVPAGWLLSRSIVDRPPGGFVSGAVAGPPSSAAVDAELQAAVDANPDVVPMRLLLARRYLEEGQTAKALAQYTAILQRRPEPEALAGAGWLVAHGGKAELGARLVEQSLAARPDDSEALWYLANIRLFGLRDPAGARAALRQLLARQDLAPDIRGQAERLLGEARGR